MKNSDDFSFSYYTEAFTDEKEKAFRTVIYNGKTELVDWVIKNYMFDDHPNSIVPSFRQQKLYILAANTLASRIAISAGLDYSIGLQLHGDYIEILSNCKNPYELVKAFHQMIFA